MRTFTVGILANIHRKSSPDPEQALAGLLDRWVSGGEARGLTPREMAATVGVTDSLFRKWASGYRPGRINEATRGRILAVLAEWDGAPMGAPQELEAIAAAAEDLARRVRAVAGRLLATPSDAETVARESVRGVLAAEEAPGRAARRRGTG